MKWFNAILRYGLIIMVVVAIAIAYVYRHQLFPAFFASQPVADIEHSTPAAITESTDTEQHISDEPDHRVETPSMPEAQESTGREERSIEVEVPHESSAGPAIDSYQTETQRDHFIEKTAPHEDSKQAPSGMNGPVREAPPLMPETTTRPSQSSSQVGDTDSRAANDKQNEASPQQRYFKLLSSARQAFWQSQYDQAIDSYQQAAELQPDNPEIYGELGNIYYTQGEWEKAGESYYQAAVRLIKHNRPDRAYYLLSVISGLKKERAAELQQQLNELQQRQFMR